MKTCNLCKEVKEDTAFYGRKGTSYLSPSCKICTKIALNLKNSSDPEKHNSQVKKSSIKNKEKIREYDKVRKSLNKDKIKEYNAKYHEANKDKNNEKSRQYRLDIKETL